jgi:TIR domain/Protein of unknown function (DUF3298)
MALKIFISYAKEDCEKALHYHDLFLQEGASPWLDVKELLPGQNWEAEIERALSDANVIVLLLSKRSVSKRGFVQREANTAIERLRYKLPTDIYVIPLLLEPCDVPDHIAARLQYVDLNAPGAWEHVRASLRLASEQQSIELVQGISSGPFKVFTEKLRDKWEGLPGHDIDIDYPRFESASRPDIARELSAFFAGRAFDTLIHSRQKPWEQSPEFFSPEPSDMAMNGRWDSFGVVHATDNLLSLVYEVGWYGAGAAHPQSSFDTYNFAYVDRLYRLQLDDFFLDMARAVHAISRLCMLGLEKEYWQRTGTQPDEGQIDWFKRGAGEDSKNFSEFTVSADHFTFLFAPYQVSSYAMGQWSAAASFYDLRDNLNPNGPYLFASGNALPSKSTP